MYPEGQRILLIDSEAQRRQLGGGVLAAEGFAVTAVAEGFSAIRVARRHFALAIIAVDLPGSLDGFTTLRQLRARQPWLKALFTGDPARRPRQLDPDRDDFIAAAFHSHELLGCVFELLQREALFSKDRNLAG